MSETQVECPHEMECVGDLVYKCRLCGHTEIGCSHSRTKAVEKNIVCEICGLTLALVAEQNSNQQQQEQCQHQFVGVDPDNMANGKIKCTKCGFITDCEHRYGDYMERSGCCFCCLCGHFTGLAH